MVSVSCIFVFVYLYWYVDHRDLHSFPTRRSSDLFNRRQQQSSCWATLSESLVDSRPTPDEPGNRTSGVGRESTSDSLRVDRKSTRLNSSHANISYAVFCLKKKNTKTRR